MESRDKRELGRNFDKSTSQRSIEQFMRKAGQDVPEKPCIPSKEVRLFRARLILEEALETIEALGVQVYVESTDEGKRVYGIFGMRVHGEPNLVEIADGCADIEVVTKGTLSACGIVDIPIQEEVNRTNLAKFTGDGHKDEHGKWIKPTDWEPPEIERLLKEQGWDGWMKYQGPLSKTPPAREYFMCTECDMFWLNDHGLYGPVYCPNNCGCCLLRPDADQHLRLEETVIRCGDPTAPKPQGVIDAS